MGNGLSAYREPPSKVLVVGFDNSGTSTLIRRLGLGQCATTIPVIGLLLESLTSPRGLVRVDSFSLGGRTPLRFLLRFVVFKNVRGLVLVVDAADLSASRAEEVKSEFKTLLLQEELQGVDVLVVANKQDLPLAVSAEKMAVKLDLDSVVDNRTITVVEGSHDSPADDIKKWILNRGCEPQAPPLFGFLWR